ncbi:MAG: hypothetical protein KKG92_15450 [Gammaproteobacteria bacterium]|nr:hypothetical protein [Gammaproteobacteria bacterium]
MKKIIVGLMVFALVAPCFAGLIANDKAPKLNERYLIDKKIDSVSAKFSAETEQLRKHVAELESKKSTSTELSNGLAVGFYGNVPILEAPAPFSKISFGYSDENGDYFGLIRIACPIIEIKKSFAFVNVGAAAVVDNEVVSGGLFLGVQKYLSPSVSLLGDIYPWYGNADYYTIGTATFGAKIYF